VGLLGGDVHRHRHRHRPQIDGSPLSGRDAIFSLGPCRDEPAGIGAARHGEDDEITLADDGAWGGMRTLSFSGRWSARTAHHAMRAASPQPRAGLASSTWSSNWSMSQPRARRRARNNGFTAPLNASGKEG
jgi:hypothetical protein